MAKKLIIDGHSVEADPSRTVLEVASELGIHIPALCHYKGLSAYGACRICLVETIWKGRSKLQTACTFPAWEGEVLTNSDKVRKARKLILELMLAEAPQAEEIHKLAEEYGAVEGKYKVHRAGADNRCIMCGLCVRTCHDLMNIGAIGFANRGYRREVTPPFDEYSEVCSTCGACVSVCPTDAIKVSNFSDRKITPILSEFDEGLKTRPAVYFPSPIAVPNKPVIDEKNCMYYNNDGACQVCSEVCDPDAICYDEKDRELEVEVDTIIVATGYDTFDAARKKAYGYGRFENVVTALQMERMIVYSAEGNPIRNMGERIAFIQCVGSRDEQIGNEYCSRICCMYATKMSQLLKRSNPSRDVYLFYTDLRAYGKGFEEYYKRAQDVGVKFVRGRPAELIENPNTKKVTVKVEDTLSRQMLESEFDLVVLSTGIVPNPGTEPIAEMLRLARSPDGFLQEAHPKFKPVDTLTEGVFLAGTVQGPKDIPDTVSQANAAALRAVRLMNQETYAMDPLRAYIHEDTCDGCGLCVPACPTDAISIASKVAKVNEALCKGCGSCTSSCPRDALDLYCYSNLQLQAQVKAALANKKNGQTRVIVFADDMASYRLADNVGTARMNYTTNSRIIKVPSGSRITPKLMLTAFAEGADGIFIAESEQKSSPYPHSAAEIEANIEAVKEILEANDVETERLRYAQFVTVMLHGFVNHIDSLSDFCIKSGPIPGKKKKTLGKDINAKLFAGSGKEPIQI